MLVHGTQVSSSAEKEVIHFWRGLCRGPTSQGRYVCLFWFTGTNNKGTMHSVVQCSYSSHSAFRARNESHSWFRQSNSIRGMEINASNVGITVGKERKEGSEERFWPELKRMHFGCALWPQPPLPLRSQCPTPASQAGYFQPKPKIQRGTGWRKAQEHRIQPMY